MNKTTDKVWTNSDGTETIEFIFGYYKLFSKHQMLPLGRTIEEVKAHLLSMGRCDIVRLLEQAS